MNPNKARAEQLAAEHPDWSNEQIASKLGVSVRSVYRYIGPNNGRQVSTVESAEEQILATKSNAKILIFDIETSPLLVASWGIYKQTIHPSQVMRDMSILTAAWKWYASPKVFSARVTGEDAANGQDMSVVDRLWQAIDAADIVVGFNSKRFDHKKLSARMLINGKPEPSPYVALDIFAEMKKKFSFSSNKLDYVNQLLGLSGKIHTDMDLWKQAIRGDDRALKYMQDYNKRDVLITEDLYDALKSWIKHPNVALFTPADVEQCPTCGAIDLKPNGFYNTPISRYESLRCVKCQALSRRRVNVLDVDSRKRQLISI